MNELKAFEQKKLRGVSTTDILTQSLEQDFDSIYILGIKDGLIYTGHSMDDNLKVLGALSYAQASLYNDN